MTAIDRAWAALDGRVPGMYENYDQATLWAGLVRDILDEKYGSMIFRSVEELEALPNQAVIYAGDNTVWQHGIGSLTPQQVRDDLGTWSFNTNRLWVTFGSHEIRYTGGIELPAFLLDDGL